MIEHFDSANGGITSIHPWSVGICTGLRGREYAGGARGHGTGTNSWQEGKRRKRRWASGRECERRERAAPWSTELFYSLNIGLNQVPTLGSPCARARANINVPPSRLYNHGSVKLTSQSCSQPRNPLAPPARSLSRELEPG